jgi:hypothetical protein
MDFGKAFSYVFEDANWLKKVGIGGALLIVPIFGAMVVYGYMLTTLKNVAEGDKTPLPEWTDFGALFMKGLYAFVGILVYFAPAIVLYCCMFALQFGGVAIASSAGKDAGSAVASILGILGACLGCVLALYGIVAGLTIYAPLTRYAMSNNQLSVFWDFKGNLDFVQKNVGNYLMALVVGLAAGFVASFGIILCVIGVLFTSFWAQLVIAHALGQFWKSRVASAAG